MSFSNLTMWASPKPSLHLDFDSLSSRSLIAPSRFFPASPSTFSHRVPLTVMHYGLRELCEHIDSIKNTQKIIEAVKLVATAKVCHAQEAIVSGCPFSEIFIEVLYNINEQLQNDDINIPLTKVCLVRKIGLVIIIDDRGLCGGFNNYVIKKAESRIAELQQLGLDYTVINVGKKGNNCFQCFPFIPVDRFLEVGSLPTTKEAQAIADDVFSLFVSEEVDKVEPPTSTPPPLQGTPLPSPRSTILGSPLVQRCHPPPPPPPPLPSPRGTIFSSHHMAVPPCPSLHPLHMPLKKKKKKKEGGGRRNERMNKGIDRFSDRLKSNYLTNLIPSTVRMYPTFK